MNAGGAGGVSAAMPSPDPKTEAAVERMYAAMRAICVHMRARLAEMAGEDPAVTLLREAADALERGAAQRRAFLERAVCHPGPPLSETEDYTGDADLGELEANILERVDAELRHWHDLCDIHALAAKTIGRDLDPARSAIETVRDLIATLRVLSSDPDLDARIQLAEGFVGRPERLAERPAEHGAPMAQISAMVDAALALRYPNSPGWESALPLLERLHREIGRGVWPAKLPPLESFAHRDIKPDSHAAPELADAAMWKRRCRRYEAWFALPAEQRPAWPEVDPLQPRDTFSRSQLKRRRARLERRLAHLQERTANAPEHAAAYDAAEASALQTALVLFDEALERHRDIKPGNCLCGAAPGKVCYYRQPPSECPRLTPDQQAAARAREDAPLSALMDGPDPAPVVYPERRFGVDGNAVAESIRAAGGDPENASAAQIADALNATNYFGGGAVAPNAAGDGVDYTPDQRGVASSIEVVDGDSLGELGLTPERRRHFVMRGDTACEPVRHKTGAERRAILAELAAAPPLRFEPAAVVDEAPDLIMPLDIYLRIGDGLRVQPANIAFARKIVWTGPADFSIQLEAVDADRLFAGELTPEEARQRSGTGVLWLALDERTAFLVAPYREAGVDYPVSLTLIWPASDHMRFELRLGAWPREMAPALVLADGCATIGFTFTAIPYPGPAAQLFEARNKASLEGQD